MKKKIFYILLFLLIGFIFITYLNKGNPYNNVIWVKNYPGTTERYVDYTPYLKSNPKIKIGNESFGADYGKIRFEDIDDDDGVKETIIETKQPFYSFDDAVSPSRIILKYSNKNNRPFFTILKIENLSD